MNNKSTAIMDRVNLILLEYRQLKAAGPHFTILHEFRSPGSICAAGEKVSAVYLVHRGREVYIPLSLTLRLFFDFLARHARLPQNASEIESCFQADKFYKQHGSNVASDGKLRRRIVRSAVRVYVERTRYALELSFREANLRLDPRNVLVSEETVMNEVGYRLRGSVDWLHTDDPR